MRFLLTGLAALAINFEFGAGRVAAQPSIPQPGGFQRPAFSPYLNLNRPGSSRAINYYGLVRPQLQAQSAIQSLEQQISSNRQSISNLNTNASGIPDTGHGVSFLNTGGYFMNLNGTGGQGGTSFGSFGGGMGGLGGSGLQGNAGIRNRSPWQNSLTQPRGSMGRIR